MYNYFSESCQQRQRDPLMTALGSPGQFPNALYYIPASCLYLSERARTRRAATPRRMRTYAIERPHPSGDFAKAGRGIAPARDVAQRPRGVWGEVDGGRGGRSSLTFGRWGRRLLRRNDVAAASRVHTTYLYQ